MFELIWPVVLAVLGSTMYQICAKETAEDIQPFASLAITYSVAKLDFLGSGTYDPVYGIKLYFHVPGWVEN